MQKSKFSMVALLYKLLHLSVWFILSAYIYFTGQLQVENKLLNTYIVQKHIKG